MINSNIQIERSERSRKRVVHSTRHNCQEVFKWESSLKWEATFNNTFSMSVQVVKHLLRSIMNMEWFKGRCVVKQEN